jgi:hypothetical protein
MTITCSLATFVSASPRAAVHDSFSWSGQVEGVQAAPDMRACRNHATRLDKSGFLIVQEDPPHRIYREEHGAAAEL